MITGLLNRLSIIVNEAIDSPFRRAWYSLILLATLVLLGAGGYMLIEDMRFAEALYMTAITITTVGFGEVQPLSDGGRVFTVALIGFGFFVFSIAISSGIEVLLGERLWSALHKRRMREWLMTVNNHYIVCGYGRIGQQIVRDLQARGMDFLVVDANPEEEVIFLAEEMNYLIGDATQDEILQQAGIERAQGFVSALDTDADNVLATLTARELNPKLFIVARSTTPSSEKKLLRVGADRVVTPYDVGGHRLSLALLRPKVHDLLNQIFDVTQMQADIGEIQVTEQSPLAGMTIGHSHLRQLNNVTILAICNSTGDFTINPGANWQIKAGDTLIVIGPPPAIYQLETKHHQP